MSTSVASVVSHFPDAENGFTSTTAGSVASGATTVTLNSVAGYTNGMPVVLVIDPTDTTKKQTFTGIVDTAGVQITSVVWTAGTNQTHDLGATVVDYATATHIAMISKGLLVSHNQDGTLKTGGAGTGVANDNLDTTAGDIGGAWLSFSTIINESFATLGNGTVVGAYTIVGKTIHCWEKFVLGSTSAVASGFSFYPPVTLSASMPELYIGVCRIFDANGVSYFGTIHVTSTTRLRPLINVVTGSYDVATTITNTIPITFTTGDVISIEYTAEIA